MTPAELKTVLDEHPLILLYFSTPTCNVCKVLKPRVEALLKEVPPWYFQYVNTEESMEIAGQRLIFAVPTLLLMADGREIAISVCMSWNNPYEDTPNYLSKPKRNLKSF